MRIQLATAALTLGLLPLSAQAAPRPLVGDVLNGAKLFNKHCKSRYKKTGLGLFTSDQMNLLTDKTVYAKLKSGECITPEQKEKFDGKSVSYLELWDMTAFIRTLHMTLDEFFPVSGRYICKSYEIDKFGLERLKEATGKTPKEKAASVFTFFNFEGEEGRLAFIPQDPIQLDHLKKDKKAGYLVFMPFKYQKFNGEIGVAMDGNGKIIRIGVHKDAKGAELLNKSLSRFTGLGRKGQSEPFKISGGKKMAKLSKAVFPIYMRAMETVTMYDREERERTWAD